MGSYYRRTLGEEMLNLYAHYLFPWLVDRAMRNRDVAVYRREIVPRASGLVLEVGIGSGLNLPLYTEEVELIIGLDPSAELLRRAAKGSLRSRRPVHLVRASAEAIPLGPASIDTVVMTWTLCSIRNPQRALREMRRVLRPNGQLLFAEHGLAPEPHVAGWQHRLDPLWTHVSCHLDRPVDALVKESGFAITDLETGYLGRGPRPMTYMYRGQAMPA